MPKIPQIIAYSTPIFESAKLTGDWPAYGTLALGATQIIMTLVCVFVIEKAGRKLLLFIGFVGMTISHFGFALFRILSVF